MDASAKKKPVFVVFGIIAAALVTIAIAKRDTISDLILKGGDVSLVGEPAKASSQAKLAMDFLTALRASDMATLSQLSTAEQAADLQKEAAQPTSEAQEMKTMMLADLPAEPAALREIIKGVQVHKSKGVVTFETKSNTWMILMDEVNGAWKVSDF